MVKLNKILFLSIIFLLLPLFCFQTIPDYPLKKDGTPSKNGIDYYIKENQNKIVSEFQNFVHDTLYDVYISTDDLRKFMEDDALGICLSTPSSSEIIITNEEKYIGYEVKLVPYRIRKVIIEANNLVKGTLIHELGHFYFNQVIREISSLDTLHTISREYTSRFLIIPKKSFGAKFIEEGICEYILLHLKEEIVAEGQFYLMQSSEFIMAEENHYRVLYQYSPQYLNSFINKFGVKKAIQILVNNSPPSIDEILYPEKFYSRLIIN
jgi:hypothetical protein